MRNRGRQRRGRCQRRTAAQRKAQWITPCERVAIDSDRPCSLRRIEFLDRAPAQANRKPLTANTQLCCFETYNRGTRKDRRKGHEGGQLATSDSAHVAQWFQAGSPLAFEAAACSIIHTLCRADAVCLHRMHVMGTCLWLCECVVKSVRSQGMCVYFCVP